MWLQGDKDICIIWYQLSTKTSQAKVKLHTQSACRALDAGSAVVDMLVSL